MISAKMPAWGILVPLVYLHFACATQVFFFFYSGLEKHLDVTLKVCSAFCDLTEHKHEAEAGEDPEAHVSESLMGRKVIRSFNSPHIGHLCVPRPVFVLWK